MVLTLGMMILGLTATANEDTQHELIENREYTLRPVENGYSNSIFCDDEQSVAEAIINREFHVKVWVTMRVPPPGCLITNIPVLVGTPEIVFLVVDGNNTIFGLFSIEQGDKTFWSYVDNRHLIKKQPDGDPT